MIEAGAFVTVHAARDRVGRAAAEILDHLPVTERQFHHLKFTSPLVAALGARVLAHHASPARVLIIGPESLLPLALRRMGYDVDLWDFAEGYLAGDAPALVRARVTPEQLAAGEAALPAGGYDVIIAPFILESLPASPAPFLRLLRSGLRPGGSLLLATANLGRLDRRWLAATGGDPAQADAGGHVSLSWPTLPRRRLYHHDQIAGEAVDVGLRVRESAWVLAEEPFTLIDPLGPAAYLRRKAADWLMRLMPSTRHVVLLHLAERLGAAGEAVGPDREPSVSVVVVGRTGEATRRTLRALAEQDHPADRLEIVVLHDGRSPEVAAAIAEVAPRSAAPVRAVAARRPEGPAARNAAMAAATGDICVHTDDGCLPPATWVRSISAAFDATTGVVTGPVLEQPGSYPQFLALPGTRPWWDDRGLYPIFNVAYRRMPALAVGGFDEAATDDSDQPTLFWDTELAYRLQRQGWRGRYLTDVFLYRYYQRPTRRVWMEQEWRQASQLPPGLARIPELRRRLLHAGCFAAAETLYFDLLLLGLLGAATGRRWRWLALALPWLMRNSVYFDLWPVSRWLPSARLIAGIGARYGIWFGGLAVGSLKVRRPIL
jgi:hypothetical protein